MADHNPCPNLMKAFKGLSEIEKPTHCACGHLWEARPNGCDCLAPTQTLPTVPPKKTIGSLPAEAGDEV